MIVGMKPNEKASNTPREQILISQLHTDLKGSLNEQSLAGKHTFIDSPTSENACVVSVFDRGYLYGDSLYEVARTYDGGFYMLDEHLERLEKSAELNRMKLTVSKGTLKREMERAAAAFRERSHQSTDVYCRVIVSRGVGKIGFGLNAVMTGNQVVIIVQKVETPTPESFEKGLSLHVGDRLRNSPQALTPAMKSGNYLNNVLAFLEANEAAYDDSVMCNSDGHLTEGTTFNLFYIKRGIVATPPFEIGMLDGITRTKVMKLAQDVGLEVRVVRFPKERLYEADEIFVTGTVKEVFPVTRVNEHKFHVGPITRKLAELYKAEIGQ